MANNLVDALFRTEALQLAPAEEVFWYTSGTVGPYYINTHFLFGGRAPAEALLQLIDDEKGRGASFLSQLEEALEAQYAAEPIYAEVIDCLVEEVGNKTGGDFDWISAGERRDWFFAPLVGRRLGKPVLYIYKDLKVILAGEDQATPVEDLSGGRSVHIADLVTEASSYLRGWLPALRERGGQMGWAVNVVDRGQGGSEILAGEGVEASYLLRVDESLFAQLHAAGRIDANQQELLGAYYRDPHGAMKAFLQERPHFIRRALASEDRRLAERARLLTEQNPYDLDPALFEG